MWPVLCAAGAQAPRRELAIYARIYSRKTSNKVRLNASRTPIRRVSRSEPNFNLLYYRRNVKGLELFFAKKADLKNNVEKKKAYGEQKGRNSFWGLRPKKLRTQNRALR